jgi:hypothetical protein
MRGDGLDAPPGHAITQLRGSAARMHVAGHWRASPPHSANQHCQTRAREPWIATSAEHFARHVRHGAFLSADNQEVWYSEVLSAISSDGVHTAPAGGAGAIETVPPPPPPPPAQEWRARFEGCRQLQRGSRRIPHVVHEPTHAVRAAGTRMDALSRNACCDGSCCTPVARCNGPLVVSESGLSVL